MKATGKFNPITGHEIMETEKHDLDWDKREWHKLNDFEKSHFITFMGFTKNFTEDAIRKWYDYYRKTDNG